MLGGNVWPDNSQSWQSIFLRILFRRRTGRHHSLSIMRPKMNNECSSTQNSQILLQMDCVIYEHINTKQPLMSGHTIALALPRQRHRVGVLSCLLRKKVFHRCWCSRPAPPPASDCTGQAPEPHQGLHLWVGAGQPLTASLAFSHSFCHVSHGLV